MVFKEKRTFYENKTVFLLKKQKKVLFLVFLKNFEQKNENKIFLIFLVFICKIVFIDNYSSLFMFYFLIKITWRIFYARAN
jgi:hypothetical protein